jgi:hypothetical protein
MGEVCNINWESLNGCTLLVGNLDGKRPLGRPIRRWVYNKKDHKKTGLDCVIWLRIWTCGELL